MTSPPHYCIHKHLLFHSLRPGLAAIMSMFHAGLLMAEAVAGHVVAHPVLAPVLVAIIAGMLLCALPVVVVRGAAVALGFIMLV